MTLVVGPILGFRGVENGEWHTCALVVASGEGASPELRWSVDDENWSTPEPTHLKSFKDFEVWRFDWAVKQEDYERVVEYALEDGGSYSYSVPAEGKAPRIAYASCAGFHSLKDMKGMKSKNAMWSVLAEQHGGEAYHLLVMGGDQVYSDLVWDEVPPLQDWLDKPLDERLEEPFTEEMRARVERFYFDLYCTRWSQREPARVMSQVPSLMMWDDHDIFDGWGSYPKDQQENSVYKGIYEQAREHFRLFQLQASDDQDLPAAMVLEPGAQGEQDNFTYAYRIGDVALAVLDMRSERTGRRVMGLETWKALREWTHRKVPGCKHLLVISSIPVVYVNANMLESTLGFVPGHQDLEDDLRDQWRSRAHREERVGLVHELLDLSKRENCRVTIVSGDVHLAALGSIESERDGSAPAEASSITQLISSPIVNKPLSGKLIYLLEQATTLMGLMGRKVEEVDRGITAQMLQFPGSAQRFIGARNWLGLELDEQHRLCAEWYAEDKEEPYVKVVYPIDATAQGAVAQRRGDTP